MAAKKKTKQECRDLVASARARFAVTPEDSIATVNEKARALIDFYVAEGFGKRLAKDEPLQRCLAERGTLVTTSHAPVSDPELRAFEKDIQAELPADLRGLLAQGGVRFFHRDPQQEVDTLSLEGMRQVGPSVAGLLDLPAKEPGEISADRSTWRYGVTSGVLPEALRSGAIVLPLAPYYGDYGAHFVALHLKREDGTCPHFIGTKREGDVTFYANSTKEWFAFFARLTLREILWDL